MENIIYLQTNFHMILKRENFEFIELCMGDDDDKSITIDLDSEEFFVYPVFSKDERQYILPYSFCIYNSGGILTSDNNNAKLFYLGQNKYDLIFFPNKILNTESYNVILNEKFKIDGENIIFKLVSLGGQYLQVITDKDELVYFIKTKLTSYKIKKINNCLALIGKTENQKKYICILSFGDKINIDLEIVADEIEISSSEIKTLQKLYDICSSAKILSYAYNDAERKFLLNSQQAGLIDGKIQILHDLFVPFAFLEAVMAGNEKLASEYLNENLKSKLKGNWQTNYFGDIYKIENNKFGLDYVVVCYYLTGEESIRYYSFEIENNKITSINKLNLTDKSTKNNIE